MMDFYADWCESCVRMDRHVFSLSEVKQELTDVILLRADVTANSEFDQALLNQFHVVAPPAILFFSSDGEELATARMIGEIDSKEFLNYLKKIKESQRASKTTI